jgi:rare lipoprotein A
MKKYIFIIAALLFAGCASKQYVTRVYNVPGVKKGTQKPYSVNGEVYYPKKTVPIGWTQRGVASWYGPNFHGKYTSNGEIYNMYAMTAAHKTLPMDTMVKVTNLNNQKSVIVRINDRGPFVRGRIIDLSYAAGKKLGLDITGTAPVKLVVVGFKGKNYVTGYKIQIGAFLRKEGAQKTAQKYKELGYNTEIIKAGDFYKVYVVGFKSYNEAKRFKLINKLNGFIIGD